MSDAIRTKHRALFRWAASALAEAEAEASARAPEP